jgi:hypothetical protein
MPSSPDAAATVKSVGAVSVRACGEAPAFMDWCAMVVPTYPEGGSQALQVCQHHHPVVRVGHFVGLSDEGLKTRKEHVLATAPAESAETFTV